MCVVLQLASSEIVKAGEWGKYCVDVCGVVGEWEEYCVDVCGVVGEWEEYCVDV